MATPGSGWSGGTLGGVPTTARYEVDLLFRGLVEQFSRARLPMPVVVLHAAEPDPALDGEVEAVVTAIQEAQESGGLPHRLVTGPEGGDPHRNAIALLEAVARGPWARRGPAWYRNYPTPRSRLVARSRPPPSTRSPNYRVLNGAWTSGWMPSWSGCASCTGGPPAARRTCSRPSPRCSTPPP